MLGKPGVFTGYLDENGKTVGDSWQQWSWTFRAHICALSPVMRANLEKAGANVAMQTTYENSRLTPEEREFSCSLFYVFAMTCKGRALAVIQRVPEQSGFEAWRQLCTEFEPHLLARFQVVLQNILNPAPSIDMVEGIYGWEKHVE